MSYRRIKTTGFILCLLGLCSIPLVAILATNDGRFSYTLDDAYIHLSLSEGIHEGHYGINPGETSSPSSSLMWPILLAPFSGLVIHQLVPLFINLCCLIAEGLLLRRILSKALPETREITRDLMTIILLLALNQIGLIYTGMEHSLQNLLSLSIVAGLVDNVESGSFRWTLGASMALLPLVRYEGFALSFAALTCLAGRRARLAGMACFAAGLALASAGSLFLIGMGLPALPSSVLAKTQFAVAGCSPLGYLSSRILSAFENPRAVRLLLMSGAMASLLIVNRRRPSANLLRFGVISTTLHLLFGNYGWFARYDVYILLSSIVVFLWAGRQGLEGMMRRIGATRVTASLGVFLLVLFAPEIRATLFTPRASNEIFRQHWTMRRLAAELYQGAVIANDIGVLSYMNDQYVVDIAGLSLDRARIALRDRSPEFLSEIVGEYSAGMALIYTKPYRDMIPDTWVLAASLVLDGSNAIVYDRRVDIYITTPDASSDVWNALDRLETQLPDGVTLERTMPGDEPL